jgi:septum formation inhibitor-activating ATPase MinD
MLGIPLLGAIPEDQQVIISTNRGEPLVLQKKLSLSGIAFENAARRLIGKQDYFVDVQVSSTRQLLGLIQAKVGNCHYGTGPWPDNICTGL